MLLSRQGTHSLDFYLSQSFKNKMFSIFCTLCLCLTVKTSTVADIQVQTVSEGSNVKIECGHNRGRGSKSIFLLWYKMSFGKLPQCLVRTVESMNPRFIQPYSDGRLTIAEDEKFDLNIKHISEDDLGTYFCVRVKESVIDFISGTLLVFQAEKIKWHLQTEMVLKSGENPTLQCSLEAVKESCAGEHSVYWFRQDSNKSAPGIIYTHINGSDQCTTGSDGGSPTHTCVYNLPLSYDRHSDGGTYYCAVAACGQILFGNGTKVHFEENNRKLVIALSVSIILNVTMVVLIGLLVKIRQKGGSICNQSLTNQSEDSDADYTSVRFTQKPPQYPESKTLKMLMYRLK